MPNETTCSTFPPCPPGTVKLLQITDTHLYADPERDLLGVVTDDSLRAVLQLLQHQHEDAHAILATGDLVHDESAAGYQRLAGYLRALDLPVYCLPGNHDDRALMATHLAGQGISLAAHQRLGPWQIILLDTQVPGSNAGHLADSELDKLEQLLSGDDAHALVCLHHNPLPVESAWLDTMAIDNGDALFAVIDRHPQVRGVLWGHVHQPYDRLRGQVRLLASPSTCIQFAPGSGSFALDDLAPGYRWLILHPDGRIDTGLCRLPGYQARLDTASGGY